MVNKTKQKTSQGTFTGTDLVDASARAVQQDWEQRDFTQAVQLGVSSLTQFLNQFGDPPLLALTIPARSCSPTVASFTDVNTRGRLAELNSKLKKLERRVELVEATLHTVDQEPA